MDWGGIGRGTGRGTTDGHGDRDRGVGEGDGRLSRRAVRTDCLHLQRSC